MKRVYLLVYGSTLGSREEVKAWLDEMPQVISWRYEVPYSFFIISEASKKELADILRERARDTKRARFLIADITEPSSRQGWLTPDTVKFINPKNSE